MSCNCHEMNRRELFEYINQISFAVDDVKLFLDTHPGNQKALEYFQKYKEKISKDRCNRDQKICRGIWTFNCRYSQ